MRDADDSLAVSAITSRSSWRCSGRASSPPSWITIPAASITYSAAGAKYGYLPLWTLLPITLVLIITQEMCSRMGAVTGKGLSDLIREEFGLRITFLMMTLLVLANFTNVMAEFAGIASSLELFHISNYISVPLSAVGVWFLVVKGNYRSVEKIFLFACVFYVTYIISGFLVKPDWKAGGHLQREAGADARQRLHLHADRHGGHHHRAVDAVLSAIGGGGKGRHRQGVCGIADGSDGRLHHDRRDRVLHHRGLRRRHLQRGAPETSRTPRRPRWGSSRSANTPSCCSAPGCSMRRFSRPASCRCPRPIRCAKGWASKPA